MFWSARCSLLRAEGFSCVLNVLYGGLGIASFDQKKKKKIFRCIFFLTFFVIKTLDPDPDSLEMLDPDSVNTDPQHKSSFF